MISGPLAFVNSGALVARQPAQPQHCHMNSGSIEKVWERRRALLLEALEDRGQTGLQEATGLAAAYLWQMAKGTGKNKRNVSDKVAAAVENAMGWPAGHMSRLASEVDEDSSSFSTIPAFAAAAGLSDGEEALDYASTHGLKFRKDSLRRKHLLGADLAVMYGKGDSMEPLIQTGDAILFNRDDRTPKHDELYVVQLPGVTLHDRISVKQAELVGSIVTFRALNPEGDHHWRRPRLMDDPRSPITVIGRVCWLGKWT